MKRLTRIVSLVLVFCAILPAHTFPGTNAPVVDTVATYTGRTVGSEVLEQLPIQKDISGILRIAPAVVKPVNIPGDNYILGNAQIADTIGPEAIILKSAPVDGSSVRSVWSCLLPENVSVINCRKMNAQFSYSPGLSVGHVGSTRVLNLVNKSGNNEFSQGIVLNPSTALPGGPKFSFFTDPERLFFPGLLTSAGISDDAKNSFQLLNFPRGGGKFNSFFFLRHNSSTGRPVGNFAKFQWNAGTYFASGSLTDVIPGDRAQPDRFHFAYKEFKNLGLPTATVQVKFRTYNANTFEQIGLPRTVTPPLRSPYPGLELQSVAFDPTGSYVAYTTFNAGCQKYTLSLRALNASGGFTGGPKLARGCQNVASYTYGITSLDVSQYEFSRSVP